MTTEIVIPEGYTVTAKLEIWNSRQLFTKSSALLSKYTLIRAFRPAGRETTYDFFLYGPDNKILRRDGYLVAVVARLEFVKTLVNTVCQDNPRLSGFREKIPRDWNMPLWTPDEKSDSEELRELLQKKTLRKDLCKKFTGTKSPVEIVENLLYPTVRGTWSSAVLVRVNTAPAKKKKRYEYVYLNYTHPHKHNYVPVDHWLGMDEAVCKSVFWTSVVEDIVR